jgi:hypothetical protein
MRNKLITVTFSCLLPCALLLASACHQNSAGDTSHHQTPQAQASTTATPLTRRVPAYFKVAPDLNSLPPTLAPEQFNGKIRDAYQVAREIPQTLAQLPCFCYCDTVGHKSLHSCYEDEHSTSCTVCLDSALVAGQLKKQGLNDHEIRDKLIAKYSSY